MDSQEQAIAAAKRAHARFKRAEVKYLEAQRDRRAAFGAAIEAGASIRGLAAAVGVSPAMVQKLTERRE